MYIKYFRQTIMVCVLAITLVDKVMADSFLDALLRFWGISITTSQVRGRFIEGNIWLINVEKSDAKEMKRMTTDGIYHSPLWIPMSDGKILAIKENLLVELNSTGSKEKIRRSLSGFTLLLGFDKNDANTVLIIQDSAPALLSLDCGKITPLPFDKENPKHLDALDQLMSDFRDYGNTKVFIEKQSRVDASGHFKQINKIHIKNDRQDLVIPCPSECAQPAYIEEGKRLIFIAQ